MKYKCKVRSFPGALIDDMYDYLEPLLKKKPKNIILHVGTNDSAYKSAGKMINELKNLAIHVKEVLPDANIYISNPTIRTDNATANHRLNEVRNYVKTMKNSIFNENIDISCLSQKGLHLNPKGAGRLAINFISLMKRF